MPKDQMFAGLKTEPIEETANAETSLALDGGPVPSGTEDAHDGAILPEAKPAQAETTQAAPPEMQAPVKTAETAPDAVKTEPAAGDATAKVVPAPTTTGTHYIQLGSVKDKSGAEAEWKKMQKDFPALASLSLRVQEADLGAKGKFYRIQGGSVAQDKAKSICAEIAAKRPGGCIVVAR